MQPVPSVFDSLMEGEVVHVDSYVRHGRRGTTHVDSHTRVERPALNPLVDPTPGVADSPGENARTVALLARYRKFDPPRATAGPSGPSRRQRAAAPGASPSDPLRSRVTVKPVEDTEAKLSFGRAYELWLEWPTSDRPDRPKWADFVAYLERRTGKKLGPNASARLRQYVRKQQASTRWDGSRR